MSAEKRALAPRLVRYTDAQLRAMSDESDWKRAEATTEEQIDAAMASDPDEAGMIVDRSTASIDLPTNGRERA
ncbi:hypothetical protein [Methylosinus sp. PW1]|uniref:hypothetical protein n=1 Tax=Methylosinus sp. PW1 TaxID=107636 RepID=UPI0005669441|nr:hypothetical protein [Methylosinus sp. PW1]